MNNSKLILDNFSIEDSVVDNTPLLREKEAELVRIIEALNAVKASEGWNTLKSLIFDGLLENLERSQRNVAESAEIKDSDLYRLQGKIFWARKYADLDKLADVYRLELSNLRKQLNV